MVVTGLGGIASIGNSAREIWDNSIKGVSGAGYITKFDTTNHKVKFACEIKGYDPLQHFDKKELKRMDLYTQYALICTEEALRDSNLNLDKLDKTRIAVVWSSGIGGLKTLEEELSSFYLNGRIPRFNPFFVPKMIVDIASGYISIKYNIKGPSYSTVSACSSSSNAIVDGFLLIKHGVVDIAIVGGSEAAITEAGVGGFAAMQALSTRNDDPTTASRPFDKDRDGFVMGEGGATLILENHIHALKRDAKIYAEIAGFGLSSDAYHLTAPHPNGEGAVKSMLSAITYAKISPSDVDCINAHATSTKLGDEVETKAILNAFGEDAYKLNITAPKSMIGHCLGAAGAIESLLTVLIVYEDIVPPTINHFSDDPNIDNKLNFTFNAPQKRTVNFAINNSFGFGGHNCSILFKKWGI